MTNFQIIINKFTTKIILQLRTKVINFIVICFYEEKFNRNHDAGIGFIAIIKRHVANCAATAKARRAAITTIAAKNSAKRESNQQKAAQGASAC